MMYLDSWIWLSYFSDDITAKKVEKLLKQLQDGKRAVFSTLGLTEVLYVMRRKGGKGAATRIHQIITSFSELVLLPVTEEVAVLAAELRDKYYDKKHRALSYADAVHLATASLSGCERFYTGDPDFSDVSEVRVELIGSD